MMGEMRDHYENWIQRQLEDQCPDLVEPIRAAVRAYERILASFKCSGRSLQVIVDAACSTRVALSSCGGHLLANLTVIHQAARDAVLGMSEDRQSHVRINAIHLVSAGIPHAFSVPIIQKGLNDRSATVRRIAADRALHLNLKSLVGDLQSQLARETDERTKKAIDYSLRLLRDGYILKPKGKGEYCLTVPTLYGGVAGRFVTKQELKKKGIQALVAEVKKGP
jgi:hypothetical protein